jgi:signal transduction histidine kinase
VAWFAAVAADLVINKPLGLSPKGIEFKRAHLYDINPVGVGAMLLASTLSVAAFLGAFGAAVQPFATLISLGVAFIAAPLIAWATGGRYYLARADQAPAGGAPRRCVVCEREYESDDMAHCPAYQGHICSLCCALDARCHDLCKPQATMAAQWAALVGRRLPAALQPWLHSGLGHFLLLMLFLVPALALLLGLLYLHQAESLGREHAALVPALQASFIKAYAALLLVTGVVAWWLVLAHKSRLVAQEESNRQTHLLMREIELHRRTDEQLQRARAQADQANQAKTRYITTISHEMRTPLNSILGYAQMLADDPQVPEKRRQALRVIRRSGEHLLSLIEGTLDIARIEGGKLKLERVAFDFPALVDDLVHMFALQARDKGIGFRYRQEGELPAVVRADEKRLRQILINIVGNAVKFTLRGEVVLGLRYAREMAVFEVRDSGPGIAAEDLARIFEPFARGVSGNAEASGTGLGLTIARMLTDLMGGEIQVDSVLGQGSTFRIRLFLPRVAEAPVLSQPSRTALHRVSEPPPQPAWVYPQPEALQALDELIGLGYLRGILAKLDQIEADEPACAEFVRRLRSRAREFQFDAMRSLIQAAHESRA